MVYILYVQYVIHVLTDSSKKGINQPQNRFSIKRFKWIFLYTVSVDDHCCTFPWFHESFMKYLTITHSKYFRVYYIFRFGESFLEYTVHTVSGIFSTFTVIFKFPAWLLSHPTTCKSSLNSNWKFWMPPYFCRWCLYVQYVQYVAKCVYMY